MTVSSLPTRPHGVATTIQRRPTTATFDGHGGCFIETGSGDFYAEPSPAVNIRPQAGRWHLGKVTFEYIGMKRRP